MAVPARKFETGDFMEERVARLEVKVDHLQSDVTELKTRMIRVEEKIDGVRETLDKKIDAVRESLEKKIETLRETLEGKIDKLNDAISSLKVARWVDRVWWLVGLGAMLGVMARGFKWI